VLLPAEGLNWSPLTPLPLHVPPSGLPTKVIGASLEHKGPTLPTLTVGVAFTTIAVLALPGQPFWVRL
jgi:hypothetical protein